LSICIELSVLTKDSGPENAKIVPEQSEYSVENELWPDSVEDRLVSSDVDVHRRQNNHQN